MAGDSKSQADQEVYYSEAPPPPHRFDLSERSGVLWRTGEVGADTGFFRPTFLRGTAAKLVRSNKQMESCESSSLSSQISDFTG